METSKEESYALGKSGGPNIVVKDCTVVADLRRQLYALKEAVLNIPQAIITFQNQSVQMFFSPENAIADFRRKVKELWNIPAKMYYLLVNGVHESLVREWNKFSSVPVNMRGLGGVPIRYRYAFRFEGKRTKSSGPVKSTARDIASKEKFPLESLRVSHKGRILTLSSTLEEIFGEEDNSTCDFEKGTCFEIVLQHPQGEWRGSGGGEQTFAELASIWN
jgi:hypothetical protein